jgi:hypothetical protein
MIWFVGWLARRDMKHSEGERMILMVVAKAVNMELLYYYYLLSVTNETTRRPVVVTWRYVIVERGVCCNFVLCKRQAGISHSTIIALITKKCCLYCCLFLL